MILASASRQKPIFSSLRSLASPNKHMKWLSIWLVPNKLAFAINFLVPDVAIGVTMKSVTYFRGGMPILNTVDGDTKEMVNKYHMGFNVLRENPEKIIEKILSLNEKDICEMKKNSRTVFLNYFTKSD